MTHPHHFTNIAVILSITFLILIGGASTGSNAMSFIDPSINTIEDTDPLQPKDSPVTTVVSVPAGIFASTLTQNMKTVFAVGREIGHPETLQAILLKETRGGQTEPIGNKGSPVGKRSYGLMQVQTVAARSVFQRFPEVYQRYFPTRKYNTIADEEIIALLLTNDEANIRIAAYHFQLYLRLSGGNWNKAVAAYNTGIGAVERIGDPAVFPYVVDVRAKIATEVREFNRKHQLQLTQRF